MSWPSHYLYCCTWPVWEWSRARWKWLFPLRGTLLRGYLCPHALQGFLKQHFLVLVRITFSSGEDILALRQRWFQVTATRLYPSHRTSSVFPRNRLILPQNDFSHNVPWLSCTLGSVEHSWFPKTWPLVSKPHQQTYIEVLFQSLLNIHANRLLAGPPPQFPRWTQKNHSPTQHFLRIY